MFVLASNCEAEKTKMDLQTKTSGTSLSWERGKPPLQYMGSVTTVQCKMDDKFNRAIKKRNTTGPYADLWLGGQDFEKLDQNLKKI